MNMAGVIPAARVADFGNVGTERANSRDLAEYQRPFLLSRFTPLGTPDPLISALFWSIPVNGGAKLVHAGGAKLVHLM
jgi:hypothetical protein